MKLNTKLSLFALSLLLLAPTKQTFALDNNRIGWQDSETDTAVAMAQRVNTHRQEIGLPAYAVNDALTRAAQQVADHMAATEFTSHYDGNGANPSQRALQAGYEDHVTEIIYGGFGGSDAAWQWWSENDLHYGLIINEDYHEFGVGMAVGHDSGRAYWAIMFGTGLPVKEAVSTFTPSVPPAETKLTGTTATAVPPPVPTASEAPTLLPDATNSTVALTMLEENPNNETNGVSDEPNNLTPPPEPAYSQDEEDSTWLIIAAALTIIVGAVFFYFPRARSTRSS